MSMAQRAVGSLRAASFRALAVAALALACALVPARAYADEPQEKQDEPVITHEVEENADDEYGPIADWSQGVQIPFKVTGTMALWLEDVSPYEYWFVIEPDPGMRCVPESARFTLVHADGEERDVTEGLTAVEVNGKLVAGSANLRAAIRDLLPTDTLVLDYDCVLTSSCKLGFAEGNAVYAHVEYTARPATWSRTAPTRPAPAMVAQAADPRSEGLDRTPEIKTTVYSYGIEAAKLADDTQGPLAGAGFVLRDSEGLYYVKDDAWTENASEATVVRSSTDGKVAFPGLDAGSYVLEETSAPRGYDAADPIDVTIESGVVDGELSIKASSRATTIAAVNSAAGTVAFTVVDKANGEAKDSDDPNGNGGGSGGNGNGNGSGNGGSGNGSAGNDGPGGNGSSDGSGARDGWTRPASGLADALLAATGDPVTLVGLALLAIGSAAAAIAAARRRKSARKES